MCKISEALIKVLLQTAVCITSAQNSTCKLQKNYSIQFRHKTPSYCRMWSFRTSLMMESLLALLGRLSISQTPLLSLHPELVCGEMKQRPTAGCRRSCLFWCSSDWVTEWVRKMQNRGREREGCKGGGAIEGRCLCLMMVVLRRNQEGLQRRVSGGNI